MTDTLHCKGSYVLGTDCGQCPRCRAERSANIGKLQRLAELERLDLENREFSDVNALTLLAEIAGAAERPSDGSRLAAHMKSQTQALIAMQRAFWLVLREHCGGRATISLEALRSMNIRTAKITAETGIGALGLVYRAEGGDWPAREVGGSPSA